MRVLARSESLFAGGRDELTFRGVGQMEKTEYDHRLRYTAQNEADGSGVASELRLETSLHRAVVITESQDGGYGLLLDPRAETVTQITGGDGGADRLRRDHLNFGDMLHRIGNDAGFGLRRTFIKSLFGDVHQLPNFPGNLANGKRICRITNKPLHKRTAIHRYDVSLDRKSVV